MIALDARPPPIPSYIHARGLSLGRDRSCSHTPSGPSRSATPSSFAGDEAPAPHPLSAPMFSHNDLITHLKISRSPEIIGPTGPENKMSDVRVGWRRMDAYNAAIQELSTAKSQIPALHFVTTDHVYMIFFVSCSNWQKYKAAHRLLMPLVNMSDSAVQMVKWLRGEPDALDGFAVWGGEPSSGSNYGLGQLEAWTKRLELDLAAKEEEKCVAAEKAKRSHKKRKERQ